MCSVIIFGHKCILLLNYLRISDFPKPIKIKKCEQYILCFTLFYGFVVYAVPKRQYFILLSQINLPFQIRT